MGQSGRDSSRESRAVARARRADRSITKTGRSTPGAAVSPRSERPSSEVPRHRTSIRLVRRRQWRLMGEMARAAACRARGPRRSGKSGGGKSRIDKHSLSSIFSCSPRECRPRRISPQNRLSDFQTSRCATCCAAGYGQFVERFLYPTRSHHKSKLSGGSMIAGLLKGIRILGCALCGSLFVMALRNFELVMHAVAPVQRSRAEKASRGTGS